jgi:hypothetical protein
MISKFAATMSLNYCKGYPLLNLCFSSRVISCLICGMHANGSLSLASVLFIFSVTGKTIYRYWQNCQKLYIGQCVTCLALRLNLSLRLVTNFFLEKYICFCILYRNALYDWNSIQSLIHFREFNVHSNMKYKNNKNCFR